MAVPVAYVFSGDPVSAGFAKGLARPDSNMTGLTNESTPTARPGIARKMPVMSGWPIFADSGALGAYGPRLVDSYARLASYVDRIAKGARPADLPIERPTTFELVLNLKTANAIGLKLPQSLLVRADRLIS
ncbi:ABC transporter substrate binding protein [Variovorax sp. J22P240]|uniref:ABC transporter substrate binding protein n=1 Tax=Variovorax sp. J22P240 TaxID=3053514 RepID=UPI002575D579|nr:ABC transporter substrate binding protein [Variovorax sp. J22P240]MDL9999321.1 ABC transporter substrate binding protein [Variovorax sp. J22P240]